MSIVSIVKCTDYDEKEVKESVRKSLDLIGGLGRVIKEGTKVLIKPNLLSAKPPEAAVTTHPLVVKAMVELVKEAGGIPWVGDSSGGVVAGQAPTKQALITSGVQKAAEEAGAKVLNFDTTGTIERTSPRGNAFGSYHLAKPVGEADIIISLAKLKTHSATLYTGAVKNLYGVLPGYRKAEYHRLSPKPSDFIETLLDIFALAKPTLAVMDGIVGMEGNGPAAGNPRKIGIILAAWDAVSLDTVASKVIGFNNGKIPTLALAHRRGLGVGDLDQIQVVGSKIDEVAINDFVLPSNTLLELMPTGIGSFFLGTLKAQPVAAPELCTGCSFCANNCPVKVIKMENKLPVIDYDKCIECLCCQELCPQKAMELKPRHWIGKLAVKAMNRRKKT